MTLKPVRRAIYLWDHRPGRNIEHITDHGLTPEVWEYVYEHAPSPYEDKDDTTVNFAEGRMQGQLYRIYYYITDDSVIPITILPISGFPVKRRASKRRTI